MNCEKKIVGFTTGIFDMFNIRHLNILEKAKSMCDYLIVGVSTDELVRKEKNKSPIIPFSERAEIVKAIRYVDQVIPQIDENKIDAWTNCHFDKIFVDPDLHGASQGKLFEEEFTSRGVEIVYISHTNGITTSQLTDFMEKELYEINIINRDADEGVRIGYTTGVFDLFHIGHLNIIRRAKERCGKLIVGVSTDDAVVSYKHKVPTVSFSERIQIVKAIRYVDYVVAQAEMDKFKAWEKLHYNVMFHGSDWKNSDMYNEIEAKLNKVGVNVEFLPHTDGVSSTILAQKI